MPDAGALRVELVVSDALVTRTSGRSVSECKAQIEDAACVRLLHSRRVAAGADRFGLRLGARAHGENHAPLPNCMNRHLTRAKDRSHLKMNAVLAESDTQYCAGPMGIENAGMGVRG